MNCYRNFSCGPYEMYSCKECPASKPEYSQKNKNPKENMQGREEGKWIVYEDYYTGESRYVCSRCGAEWILIDGTPTENGMYYCPSCGKFMTETISKEEEENDCDEKEPCANV